MYIKLTQHDLENLLLQGWIETGTYTLELEKYYDTNVRRRIWNENKTKWSWKTTPRKKVLSDNK